MKFRTFLLSTVLLLSFSLVALGQSVTWTLGSVPPSSWTVSPSNPGPSDVVSFAGPTSVYSNSCVGEVNLGGTPTLAIDSINKTIQLFYQPPAPTYCTLILMPVCGLQGIFGTLSPGDWTFYCVHPNTPFAVFFTVAASGNVYYVDENSPAIWQTGSSWATAFTTLQAALAIAQPGDEIRVADGTYHPDDGLTAGDKAASFDLIDQLVLKGSYAGYGASDPDERDFDATPTILSGDLDDNDLWNILFKADNSYRVVTATETSEGTRLDGFVIKSGYANGTSAPYERGAGLSVDNGVLAVANCIIRSSVSATGGAVYCENADLYLANTQLHGNRALVNGGGIYSSASDVNMVNVLMTGNSSDYGSIFGGDAIYAQGSKLRIMNSTLADNGAGNKTVVSFVWGTSTDAVTVYNSILYNGGDEIWSNNTGLIDVQYCNVQGGYTGSGNINSDPLFVSPGAYSVEGEWYEGDYTLQSTSPSLNVGANALRPVDDLDLDDDGNVTEYLPVDLVNNSRVYGGTIDMGAYERQSSGGGGGTWLPLATVDVLYNVPNPQPGIINISGSVSRTVTSTFEAELKLEISAASAAGGTWTATWNPDPGTVGPGTEVIHFNLYGAGLNTNLLPAGTVGVKVAEVQILTRPAP